MLALFEGINKKFDTSTIAGEVNGLWYGLTQQGTPLPFVTYFLVSAMPDWATGQDCENATIQFSIWYGNDTAEGVDPLEEICELYELLKTAFDEASLTVTGYACIRCSRETSRLLRDPDGGWQYQADYRIQLQEV